MQSLPLSLLVVCVMALNPALGEEKQTDEDPFLWLEEVAGKRALEWVQQQNRRSTAALATGDAFEALRGRLLRIMDADDRIPMVSKEGGHYYNFWRDAQHRRGLWRRTTLEEYRKAKPQWETVLDLDALAAEEKENWVWRGATFLPPEYRRCLVSLSRGGADATVVREFDVVDRAFVKDGFALPEAKTSVAWRDIDSLFVATDFGAGSLTESGYPRIVKEWRRGAPLAGAATVYEGKPEDVRVYAGRSHAAGYEHEVVSRSISFWRRERFLRRGGKLVRIDAPTDAVVSPFRDLLFIELRSEWEIDGRKHAPGTLLCADLEAFLRGDRKLEALFEPSPRKSLASFTLTRNFVVLNELDNVQSRIHVLKRAEGKWRREPLPGAAPFSTISVSAADADESDEFFMHVAGFLTPPTLMHGTLGAAEPATIKSSPAYFDAGGLRVSQLEAISKDGTRVPYFQVARADLKLDGAAQALLSGYGGFEIPRLPAYSTLTGAAWLERGGVYVVANIRGGGEFGPQWHQAALKANRPRAYEDFIAVAEDLIRRRVTSPKRLGIQGGSNGGLLMGNMLTLRPDLFGAVVCQVPLLDMRRYHKLLAGASWVAEYGNPDEPSEWEFIRSFSPYHNLRKDVTYPPILFTTSTRDDRVHPSHARKMVARMQSLGHQPLYYENIEGGHGGAADNKQAAFMAALMYTFLSQELK